MKRYSNSTDASVRRVGNRWVFPDGKSLPVVSGGQDEPPATPPAPPAPDNMTPPPSNGAVSNSTLTLDSTSGVILAPPTSGTSTAPPTGYFTADDLAKARQDEKSKLYGQIEEQNAKLKEMSAWVEERKKAEADAEQARLEAERKQAEDEMSAKQLLEQREAEWNERFAQLEQQREMDKALAEKERQLAEVAAYRERRIREEAENILPELLDLVAGSSPEDIEASIVGLRQRSESILGNVQQTMVPPPVPSTPLGALRGTSVTTPPVGPMDNQSNYQTLTPEDIAAMDMNTYAANRDRILNATAHKVRESGLYG